MTNSTCKLLTQGNINILVLEGKTTVKWFLYPQLPKGQYQSTIYKRTPLAKICERYSLNYFKAMLLFMLFVACGALTFTHAEDDETMALVKRNFMINIAQIINSPYISRTNQRRKKNGFSLMF